MILITIVIVQSSKNKEKSTNKPPTTDPPACTKYKYNSSCLDTCGDKFVDETEKKCYDSIPDGKYADGKTLLDNCDAYNYIDGNTCYNDIPTGKYADGKTLLDNCGESNNNKYTFDKLCVPNCDAYNYIDGNTCYNDIPTGKYADGKTVVSSCDKYVNETERKCYNGIPDDKYADGKTLLDNCGQSQNNKIINGKMCVNICNEFLHTSQDKTIEGECKTTCDSYFTKDYITETTFRKLCYKASEWAQIFEFDNVKINNDFSRFIVTLNPEYSNDSAFGICNTSTKEVEKAFLKDDNNIINNFIDLKMSSSGSVYAKVYKNKIEIFVQDLFNQANVLPKYTIRVPQDITGLDPTLEVEDFNFCGEDNILTILSQGIIVCKSTDTTTPGKFKKIMYLLIIYNNNYQTILLPSYGGEYNISNDEIYNIYNPVHLGTVYYQQDALRKDLFRICSSFTSSSNSIVYYIDFYINYNFPNYPFTSPIFEQIGFIPLIYDSQYSNLNKYEYINVKSTYSIIAKLKLYTDNSFKLDLIKDGNYNSLLSNENVVSNIAVGCFVSNYINTISNDSTETIYYVKRENSILKLQKYKYISSSNSTTNIVAYEFPEYSSNAYAYLTSNSDGSILAIGIHDGNTKNLYKYNEVSNTVEKIF